MSDDAYRNFIAALRYKVFDEKNMSQVLLAEKVGTTSQHINAVINERPGKQGKPVKASFALQQKIADAFGSNIVGFLNFGERILNNGAVDEEEKDNQGGHSAKAGTIPTAPSDYMDPDDFVDAAMIFARMYRKSDDRLKMWRMVFENLPLPSLIIKDGIVVFQNAKSRQWGHTAGSPLCDNCIDQGECFAENCDDMECALCVSLKTNSHSTKYKVVRDGIYKIDAAPFYSGGFNYIIVTAAEVDTAEVINMANTGAPIRPNRRKGD